MRSIDLASFVDQRTPRPARGLVPIQAERAVSAAVVVLVVLSAAVHAAWNALLKRRRDPESAVLGVMAASAVTAILGAVVLGGRVPPAKSVAFALLAGLLEAGYFVTLARALARAPLGSAYTVVRGGALVVVWPISILALGERLSVGAALGTALVLVGLALTGAGDRPREASGPKHASHRWAFVCALFVAGYHLAYKVALSAGGAPRGVVAISLGTAAFVAALGSGPARRAAVARAFAKEGPVIALAGALATASFLVFLEAMARAGAGAVLTLRNTSILFAQALALVLGERPRHLVLAGAALVTAGAVLLAR